MYLCSCEESSENTARLKSTNARISESIELFKEREQSQYCIHAAVLEQLELHQHNETEEEQDLDLVTVLSLSLLCAAVTDSKRIIILNGIAVIDSLYCNKQQIIQ